MQAGTNDARLNLHKMICKQCGAEVPDRQLVCDCFKVDMDNELERRGIEGFQNGSPLLLTGGSGHLLVPLGFMTLCHEKRYKAKPKGQDLYRVKPALNWDVPTLETHRSKICSKCLSALEAKLVPTT